MDDEHDKTTLRHTLRARRAALDRAQREAASAQICLTLLGLPIVESARSVALYVPTADEVDCTPVIDALLAEWTAVLLPRVSGDGGLDLVQLLDPEQLGAGYGGVLEPTGPAHDPGVLDVVVVPGLGFDREGGRLGRGGGHYDRLLARLPRRTVRIGIAFEVQVVASVPRDGHDEPVDALVTERGAVRTTAAARLPEVREHRILPGG